MGTRIFLLAVYISYNLSLDHSITDLKTTVRKRPFENMEIKIYISGK